jgi:hypothetical protein
MLLPLPDVPADSGNNFLEGCQRQPFFLDAGHCRVGIHATYRDNAALACDSGWQTQGFRVMTKEDQIIYGTLLVVAVVLALIIWWGISVRKSQDAESRELKVDEVLRLVRDRLFGDSFLWCIWQGRLSGREFRVHVKDEQGSEITVITIHHIPKGVVLKEFDWAGKHYEYIRESLLSTRMLLRERGSGEILLSCHHQGMKDIFYRGKGEEEICRVPYTSVLRDYRPVIRNDREIGRLFMPEGLDFHLPVLSVEAEALPTVQQLFLLAGLLGK